MSRFHVGQRVRVIASPCYPEVVGCEAIVGGFYEGYAEDGEYRSDWVEVDILHHPSESGWLCTPHELEPIIDSYDKVEWSTCLWSPERVREGA